MSPYLEPPTIPEGITIDQYRRARGARKGRTMRAALAIGGTALAVLLALASAVSACAHEPARVAAEHRPPVLGEQHCAQRPDGYCIPPVTNTPYPPSWLRAVHGGRYGYIAAVFGTGDASGVTDVHAYGPRGRALVAATCARCAWEPETRFYGPRTGLLMAAYSQGTFYVPARVTVILAVWRDS